MAGVVDRIRSFGRGHSTTVTGLERFVTIDEGLWLYRSANFYYALGQREFEYMHQSKHPVVSIMWAGAAGIHNKFPEYRGLGQEYMPGFTM